MYDKRRDLSSGMSVYKHIYNTQCVKPFYGEAVTYLEHVHHIYIRLLCLVIHHYFKVGIQPRLCLPGFSKDVFWLFLLLFLSLCCIGRLLGFFLSIAALVPLVGHTR